MPQVDLNLNYDWSKICESGDKPLARPGGPRKLGDAKGSGTDKWTVEY